tara:strand:- start:4090 stop:4380 length:291 start_codon:yes stop_codon:yes gene_type:complete
MSPGPPIGGGPFFLATGFGGALARGRGRGPALAGRPVGLRIAKFSILDLFDAVGGRGRSGRVCFIGSLIFIGSIGDILLRLYRKNSPTTRAIIAIK